MDAFATAAAVIAGVPNPTYRHTFRLAWHFGFFQAGMPVLGWLGGSALSSLTHLLTRSAATVLLLIIGIRMIREAGKPREDSLNRDATRGWALVALSLVTSMDALAAGACIGLMGRSIWMPAVIIGVVTLLKTYGGVRIGKMAKSNFGPWAERLGGAVLLGIGLRVLIFA